jgi:hypothetical protein
MRFRLPKRLTVTVDFRSLADLSLLFRPIKEEETVCFWTHQELCSSFAISSSRLVAFVRVWNMFFPPFSSPFSLFKAQLNHLDNNNNYYYNNVCIVGKITR